MELIFFPFERVIEINAYILENEPGMKGAADINKLQGALGRIDNAIVYLGLNDVFEIAAKYASSIALSHSLPDANKRTGLAVALEYLSLNDYELIADNEYSQMPSEIWLWAKLVKRILLTFFMLSIFLNKIKIVKISCSLLWPYLRK